MKLPTGQFPYFLRPKNEMLIMFIVVYLTDKEAGEKCKDVTGKIGRAHV